VTSKINVADIIASHWSTLKDDRNGNTSKLDVFVFYVVPLALAIKVFFNGMTLSDSVFETFVNIGALLAGLLLNLMVLIFDRRSKINQSLSETPGDISLNRKANLLQELYFNVCYATVLALALAGLPILGLQFQDLVSTPAIFGRSVNFSPHTHFVSPLLVFLGLHMGLTMLMIVKRAFRLLTDQ